MTERLISSEQIYKGRVVEVRLDRIKTAGGFEATREVVVHPGSVALVAEDRDGRILLVRQYRHPVRQTTLELPAGTREDREPALDCAHRELREETGYRANRIERLAGFYPAPGFCNEYLDIFWATDLAADALSKEPDEEIAVERLTLAQCLEAVDQGVISDAKSIIGILTLARRRSSERSS